MRQGWIRDEQILFDYSVIVHLPLYPGEKNSNVADTIACHLGKGEEVTVVLFPEFETQDMKMSMPSQILYAIAENGIVEGTGKFVFGICCVAVDPFMDEEDIEDILLQIPPEARIIDLLTKSGQAEARERLGLRIVDDGKRTWHLACEPAAPREPSVFAEDVSSMALSMIEQQIAEEFGCWDATGAPRAIEALGLGMLDADGVREALNSRPAVDSIRYFGPMRSKCGGGQYKRDLDGLHLMAVLSGSYGHADKRHVDSFHLDEIVPRRSEDLSYESRLREILSLAKDVNRIWSEMLGDFSFDEVLTSLGAKGWGSITDEEHEKRKKALRRIACAHGIDSSIDAYAAGVPVDDILA